MDNAKQWWAPIWTGLVMDPEAKHNKRMKNAVWLYLYLVLNANRKTGFLVRKIRTIVNDMGITRDTTLRWMNVLRTNGYITSQNTGRCLLIQVAKWKGLGGVGARAPQGEQRDYPSSGNHPTPGGGSSTRSDGHLNGKLGPCGQANDISSKRDISTNDAGRIERPSNAGAPRTRQELLAKDLADALKDSTNLPLYISYCRRYPESLLRRILGEVQEVPPEKIRVNRAAFFNHLIQHYGEPRSIHPGD